MRVVVSGTTVECIHSDKAVRALQELGDISLRRGSHVEPWTVLSLAARARFIQDNGQPVTGSLCQSWFADLTPVGGPVAGPFVTKQQALDYEVAFIEKDRLCQASCPAPVPTFWQRLVTKFHQFVSRTYRKTA
jgi:hypothetical protein